jgi:hypothetical protein
MLSVLMRSAVARRVVLSYAALCAAGVGPVARGAVLYNIQPDPTDAAVTSSTTVMYDPALVAVTVAPGLTGTTAAQLNTLQTLNANATTGIAGNRFQNTDRDAAQSNNTLLTDAVTNTYYQFGISGTELFDVTSLSFDAKNATTTAAGRGYSVQVSVNGGAYAPLGSGTVSAFRGSTPAFDSVTLPTTGTTGITSIDFRVTSTTGGVEYTNISINGTVPEPASAAGLALGAAALAVRRPRSRRR